MQYKNSSITESQYLAHTPITTLPLSIFCLLY